MIATTSPEVAKKKAVNFVPVLLLGSAEPKSSLFLDRGGASRAPVTLREELPPDLPLSLVAPGHNRLGGTRYQDADYRDQGHGVEWLDLEEKTA